MGGTGGGRGLPNVLRDVTVHLIKTVIQSRGDGTGEWEIEPLATERSKKKERIIPPPRAVERLFRISSVGEKNISKWARERFNRSPVPAPGPCNSPRHNSFFSSFASLCYLETDYWFSVSLSYSATDPNLLLTQKEASRRERREGEREIPIELCSGRRQQRRDLMFTVGAPVFYSGRRVFCNLLCLSCLYFDSVSPVAGFFYCPLYRALVAAFGPPVGGVGARAATTGAGLSPCPLPLPETSSLSALPFPSFFGFPSCDPGVECVITRGPG